MEVEGKSAIASNSPLSQLRNMSINQLIILQIS